MVAACIVLVLGGRSLMLSYLTGGDVAAAGVVIENGRLIMEGPRMGGLNAAKRRYEMTAARAIQTINDASHVDLELISAKLPMGRAGWADVEAATGTMTKADNMLSLTSPTLVRTTDGMVARLQSATLDMSRGDVVSRADVEIDLPSMRVTADSMKMTDNGSVMVFERRVKVVIDGRRTDTASAGDANAKN